MTAFLLVLIVTVAVVAIGYPLLNSRSSRRRLPQAGGLQELLEERDATLAAMKDLDFDYSLGKMTREDYEALKRSYERQAVAVIKAIDARSGPLAQEVEEKVKELRMAMKSRPATGSAGAADDAE